MENFDFGITPWQLLRNSLGFTFCAIFVDFLIGVHKNPPVRQLEELQSSRLRLHGRHHCRHREASTPPSPPSGEAVRSRWKRCSSWGSLGEGKKHPRGKEWMLMYSNWKQKRQLELRSAHSFWLEICGKSSYSKCVDQRVESNQSHKPHCHLERHKETQLFLRRHEHRWVSTTVGYVNIPQRYQDTLL